MEKILFSGAKTYLSIRISLSGHKDRIVLSSNIIPAELAAPVRMVSFWKSLSPIESGIYLPLRITTTSPLLVFAFPIGDSFPMARHQNGNGETEDKYSFHR